MGRRTRALSVCPCSALVFLTVLTRVVLSTDLITDENEARAWLDTYNTRVQDVYAEYITGYWNYNTNLTSHNQKRALEGSVKRADFRKEAYENTTKYDWKNFQDEDLRRQFGKVADIGTAVLAGDDQERYNLLNADMEMLYSTAEVCREDNPTECLPLAPDLTNIMANSRDWDELLWAWKGWRQQSGRKMPEMYEEFVSLQNKAAKTNGYEDNGDYWRSWYEDPEFEQKCLNLFNQVKPLYQELHAYVRRRLIAQYNDREFPSTGHIPAHLLGNMWAQTWSTLSDIITPYPDFDPIDVTTALKEQNYTTEKIFTTAEDFFVSLGLAEMPDAFWNHSMLEKPKDGTPVVCHASAWDFYNGKDFRIKQCTEITQAWLETTHHEMGHVQYYLQYKHHPVVYRRGGNPGFHEAVGDVLSLSVSTPEHLKSLNLLKEISEDERFDLNFLMGQAMDKLAFLPFGYLIDQWRWSVFRGETTPQQYNRKWWELRCKHQGISPPVMRSDEDFDPGAKFHIPANTPYIRYFVSYILQFQFHRALCDKAGHTGPLHRCDIYNNTDAGKLLGDMLKMGSSRPWPEAMQAITGQRNMDASPLMEFFQPLTDWLKEQNADQPITWTEECPPGSFADDPTDGTAIIKGSIIICLVAVLSIYLFH